VARLPQILPAAAQGPEADPSPEELALRLQLRLQRLDAMREAGARLMGRDRHRPRRVRARRARRAAAGAQVGLAGRAFDLFAAYGAGQGAHPAGDARRRPRSVMTLEDAIERVVGDDRHGARLDDARGFLPVDRRPAIPPLGAGSSFVAALELARRAGSSSRRTSRSRRSGCGRAA
jgi:segregation and condensation protein A